MLATKEQNLYLKIQFKLFAESLTILFMSTIIEEKLNANSRKK